MANPIEDKSIQRFTNASSTPYFGFAKPAFRTNLRQDQENTIMSDLQAGEAVLVRAFYRMGQTSMLRALENRFDPNFLRVDVRTFYKRPAHELRQALDVTAQIFLDENDIQVPQQGALSYLSRYLEDREKTVLLAINEGGALTYDGDQARFIASMKNLPGLRVAVQMPLMTEGEPTVKQVFRDFKTHQLRALRQDEVDMLTKGVATTLEPSATFTDDALDGLFKLSGGRPWDVAATCEYFLWDEKAKTHFDGSDIQRLLEMNAGDLRNTHLRLPVTSYERVYSQVLNRDQKNVIDEVRKRGALFSNTQWEEEAAQSLASASWLKFDPEKSGYVFNGKLLAKALTE